MLFSDGAVCSSCGVGEPDCSRRRGECERRTRPNSILHMPGSGMGRNRASGVCAAALLAISVALLPCEAVGGMARPSTAFAGFTGVPLAVPRAENLLARAAAVDRLPTGRRGAGRHSGVSHLRALLPTCVRWNLPRPIAPWGPEPHGGRRGVPRMSAIVTSGAMTMGEDDYRFPEGETTFVAECELPTDRGTFRLRCSPPPHQ